MYKIKNLTDKRLVFVDEKYNKTVINPGEEIENEYTTKDNYGKRLEITEIKPDKSKSIEVKKDGNAR